MVETEYEEDRIPVLVEGSEAEYLVELGTGEVGVVDLLVGGEVSLFGVLEFFEGDGVGGKGVLEAGHGRIILLF